jgi:hypothetical protein
MLSVNISAYKGDIPRNHVLVGISFFSNHFAFYLPIQDIIKRYRFDLPPGIEHDYASWEKISQAVSYSLTQSRARVKKLACDIILIFCPLTASCYFFFVYKVKESIKSNTNIFALAQLIVHGTPCRPTVQLCARVALMVSTFPCCFS